MAKEVEDALWTISELNTQSLHEAMLGAHLEWI